jgi:hypothetical protein
VAFSGEMVSAAFDTFWDDVANLSFMTEVLISVALEWVTQSSIYFYVYFEVEESYWFPYVMCILFHGVRNDIQR